MLTAEQPPHFDKRNYDARPERVAARKIQDAAPDKRARKLKYRHDNSKYVTDAKYLSKRFVAVDGEGYNKPDGSHVYNLLAISNVPPLTNRNGLSTGDILEYLWRNLSPDDINVIYGGSYDFNMWLKDLLPDTVLKIYRSNYTAAPVNYGGYGMRWIKGKGFEIERDGKKVKINDVISFFQCPFIQACDNYLGEYDGRDILVREKARRGVFTPDELTNVAAYNNLELELLVRLCEELRARLNRVGLRPRRWDGPGAIAASLFLREKVKKARNENLPLEVMRAARFAYAGGRFEMLKYGAVKEKVYEYDINSAYPAALRNVPNLVGGVWAHHRKTGDSDKRFPFALYHVTYRGTDQTIPSPLFCRAGNGTVSYPLNVETWIWSPEMETLREYCEQIPGAVYDVIESWEYRAATNVKPFAFIQALYEKRRELKAKKDGAHVGIKLGLNSLYGKLAQQVGWVAATKSFPVRVPTYHQLEWAGYATSWCRSQVLRAALRNPSAVIAFETDALFCSEPLDGLTIGEGLGEWELTTFESLTYVQSGHYYGTKTDGEEVVKCRGIDKGFISRAAVESALTQPEQERYLEAALTRFYGAGIALARGLSEYWCRWRTEPKSLFLGPSGKRIHGACWCSSDHHGLSMGKWHRTYCPVTGGMSSEYPVEWINPNPEMTELTELRETENEWND